jgi:hypothetical protein
MPAKGMPGRKRWPDLKTRLMLPYYLRGIDPFCGTADSGRVEMSLFEFSGDFFKDVLDALRKGAAQTKWEVSVQMSTDEYWKHMDAEVKEPIYSKQTGRTRFEWRLRAQRWPNHLLDCEVMQVALATYYGMMSVE